MGWIPASGENRPQRIKGVERRAAGGGESGAGSKHGEESDRWNGVSS